MSDHDDLVRSLLVERFTPYPSTTVPSSTPRLVARAMAHEKRRTKTPDPRRPHRRDDTIDDTRRTS